MVTFRLVSRLNYGWITPLLTYPGQLSSGVLGGSKHLMFDYLLGVRRELFEDEVWKDRLKVLDEFCRPKSNRTGEEPARLALLFYDRSEKMAWSQIGYRDKNMVNIRRNRLTAPIANEVAAVSTHHPRLNNRSIIVSYRCKLPSKLGRFSGLCHPMCHSLLFPTALERGSTRPTRVPALNSTATCYNIGTMILIFSWELGYWAVSILHVWSFKRQTNVMKVKKSGDDINNL